MKYSLRYKLATFLRTKGRRINSVQNAEVIAMQKEISSLENKNINFEIKTYLDGSWMAKSTNVEGILTGGNDQREINEMLKDAIFTYYGVAPEHADDRLLRNSGEPVTTEQRVHVTA